MTTLVMAGILRLRHLGVSRCCRSATCPTSISRPSRSPRSLPGASPETMASVGRDAAREAVLDHRGHRLDDVDERARASRRSRIQFTLERNIDARRAGRAGGDRRRAAASCRRTCRPRRRSEGQPGRPADPLPGAQLADAAAVRRRRVRRRPTLAQRISTISGVAQVQVFGSQKYAVRVQLDPERARRARHRHRRGAAGARQTATSTCPPARSTGRHQAFTRRRPPASSRTPRRTGRSSSPIATARRCGSSSSGSVIDSVRERQGRRAGTTDERGSRARRSSASPAPTPSRSSTRSRICCRRSAPSSRRASTSTSSTTARDSIRESVHDVQFTLLLALALVVLVIFLFLRNVSRDPHPEPGAAACRSSARSRSCTCSASARQPLADGADALRSASSSTTPS